MRRRSDLSISLGLALPIVLSSVEGYPADLAAGWSLVEKWCTECHGVRTGQLGPNAKAPTFQELAAEPSITEYSLRALLRSPHETMPQITFTPDQLDDVVGYIMSLKSSH
jgi:mono/diheme cytochrome c family protein